MFSLPSALAEGGPMVPLRPHRSIFDIVYQIITPNGTARRPNPLVPRTARVNFLYMGLFLGIEK
jgi:hypothetical protein